MNKLIIVARRMAIIAFILTIVNIDSYSHTTPLSESTFSSTVPIFSDQDIIDRLGNISSVIDLNYTPEVGRRIREYTVEYRTAGERILGRVDLYFPLFEKEISKRNLPDELKYVAVVESNLDPKARSKSGAVGLWQFIKSTGKMQGLSIDNYIDERQDTKKATKAALDYLSELFDQFGDWTLAIAAYNCGPGNVRKAIRRGNSRNFWEIRSHLPQETQKYVPRIIAAIYLMQYYHYHDLAPMPMDQDLKNTISISDGQQHNFYTLASSLEVDYDVLKSLNPQFKTKYFPKNSGHLALVIPKSKYETYLSIYDPEVFEALMQRRRAEELKKEQQILESQRRETIGPIMILEGIQPTNVYSKNSVASVNISH